MHARLFPHRLPPDQHLVPRIVLADGPDPAVRERAALAGVQVGDRASPRRRGRGIHGPSLPESGELPEAESHAGERGQGEEGEEQDARTR